MKTKTVRAIQGSDPKAAHLKKVTLPSVFAMNKKAASQSKEKTVQARPNTTVQCSPEAQREAVLNELVQRVQKVTGTKTDEAAHRLVAQTSKAQIGQASQPDFLQISTAMAALGEMQPTNMLEAQIAVQMIATHEAALSFLAAATPEAEDREASVAQALQLMRVHLEQVEVFRKLRGGARRDATR